MSELKHVVKPLCGIIPHDEWKRKILQERIDLLTDAIADYTCYGRDILAEWLEEVKELEKELKGMEE